MLFEYIISLDRFQVVKYLSLSVTAIVQKTFVTCKEMINLIPYFIVKLYYLSQLIADL